jgi:hypothetical protein
MRYSLGREPWWNAGRRTRCVQRVAAPLGAEVGATASFGVPLSFFFRENVARMGAAISGSGVKAGNIVPAYRLAHAGYGFSLLIVMAPVPPPASSDDYRERRRNHRSA